MTTFIKGTVLCFTLVLAVSIMASKGQCAVELRFQPSEKNLTYVSSQREKISRTYNDSQVKQLSYTVKKKILETIKEETPGRLTRNCKQLAGSLKYMDKAKVKAYKNPEYTEYINVLGEELPPEGAQFTPAADRIRLVFPAKPVDEGDKWSYDAPPTDVFPGVLKTVYTVKSIDDSHSIAVLQSSTAYKGTHTSTGVEVSVRSNGVIHFDYGRGILLKSLTSTTIRTVYLAENNEIKESVQTTDAKYKLQK